MDTRKLVKVKNGKKNSENNNGSEEIIQKHVNAVRA